MDSSATLLSKSPNNMNVNSWLAHRELTIKTIPESEIRLINKLLKRNKFYDYSTILIVWIMFIVLVYSCQWFYTSYIGAIVFIVFQGFVIHTLGQLGHEYYVHSKTAYSYFASITSLITPFSITLYKKRHIQHHKHFPNALGDPDIVVNDIKTSLEKILSFTVLDNFFLLPIRKKKLAAKHIGINNGINKKEQLIAKIEGLLFWVGLIIACLFYFFGIKQFILGWIIPLIVGTPIFLGIRVFVEHAILNDKIPFGCGTNVKIPWFFKFTPYASLYGEGHIVHHYFPTMPWYNINRACVILRPYFTNQNRESVLSQICKWILKNG